MNIMIDDCKKYLTDCAQVCRGAGQGVGEGEDLQSLD